MNNGNNTKPEFDPTARWVAARQRPRHIGQPSFDRDLFKIEGRLKGTSGLDQTK